MNLNQVKGFDRDSLVGLDFLWMEITSKCNLECVHCYADSRPESNIPGDMASSDWTNLMDEALRVGCEKVQFIGGEPLTHPDFPHLLKYATNKFDFVEVYTNAILLNDNKISLLHQGEAHLAVSIYSNAPDIHDKITNQKGSFTNTINNVKKALVAGIPTRVGIVSLDGNEENIRNTVSYVESIGITQVNVDRVRSFGRGSDCQCNQEDLDDSLCGNCWKGSLCVTETGDAFPCIMSRHHNIGNVKDGFDELIYGKNIISSRKTIKQIEEIKFKHQNEFISASCIPHYCNPCAPHCNPKCNPWCNPSTSCSPY